MREPEIEIGAAVGEDAYVFQSVQSARFLPDGRIVVSDRGQHVLRVYGPEGDFRREFGGEGEGPGEFRNIKGTWLTPDGRIAVWDAVNLRITTFTPGGKLATSERASLTGTRRDRGNLDVFLGAFRDGDALLAMLRFGSRLGTKELAPDPWRMVRFGLDGERRAKVGRLEGMRRLGGRPLPFSPVPLVAVAEDTIFAADGYGTDIIVRDVTGSPVRALRLPRRERSVDDVWSRLEAELRRRASTSHVYKLFLKNLEEGRVPRSGPYPQLGDLLVDERGLLWVKSFELPDDALYLREKGALWPSPGGEWRVIEPDGDLVATVRMPEDVRPLEIQGDRILGLSTDKLGVERVVVHRIEGRLSP